MNTNTPHIAVIGAGPGGLACARMLQQHGVDVTVYDRDNAVDDRDPGGTLDLHADTGQIALADAGLEAEFTALSRPEGQFKTTRDQHGTLLNSFEPEQDDTAAPEIDRGQLRALLAASVLPGTIQWGHKLRHVEPLGGGRHRLEFDGGGHVDADVVIGADGASSRVRPLLTSATTHYSGVTFFDVRFDDADHRHPQVAELVGDGHMFSRDNTGRAIIGQRNSNGRVRGFVALRIELEWHLEAGINLDDTPAVRRFLLSAFDGWAERMLTFVTDNDGPYVSRPIHTLPAPLRWDHNPGVTLLGDAAHVMSPFGGHGVNLAMLDGVELAHAIATAPTIEAAIIRYERTMFERSGPLAVNANAALEAFFGSGDREHRPPDHHAEHAAYRAAAIAYRERSAQASSRV
ncbi:MAG TPA: NAD(P)/FAD-dependent oxidoreductase [Ruania sp.]|nr:NAD(P)/FAD-dependent oxidoreductase [Ruania sp.]